MRSLVPGARPPRVVWDMAAGQSPFQTIPPPPARDSFVCLPRPVPRWAPAVSPALVFGARPLPLPPLDPPFAPPSLHECWTLGGFRAGFALRSNVLMLDMRWTCSYPQINALFHGAGLFPIHLYPPPFVQPPPLVRPPPHGGGGLAQGLGIGGGEPSLGP